MISRETAVSLGSRSPRFIFDRRWAMIVPATIGALVASLYLFTDSYAIVAGAFIMQGAFLDAIYGQNPCYLSERLPTEVRATASSFCYHQGAIWAGFTGPVLTYFAASQPLNFTVPMLRRRCVRRLPAVQPGDERRGARSAARLGGGVVRRVTPSPLALWPGTFTLSVLGHLLACAHEALE